MNGFEGTRRAAKYKATERSSSYWRLPGINDSAGDLAFAGILHGKAVCTQRLPTMPFIRGQQDG